MKKIFSLLKDIVGWLFLASMIAASLFALVFLNFDRHQIVDGGGLAVTLCVFAVVATVLCLFLWWICRAYGVRSTAIVFGGFAILLVLFYAEEDWRGWHAWQSFKNQREAKGEKLDFASIAPPPVPEDENFAMTPIVASSYATMLSKDGHEVIPRNTNVVNRLDMRFDKGVLDKFPDMGSWQKGTMTDLDDWQNYYRSLAAEANVFPVPQRPQSPAQDVLLALSRYDVPIEELRQASRLPLSRFPLSYTEKNQNPAAILLPHLAALKSCSQTLSLRAVAELQNHQSEQALDDTTLALQLVGKVRTEPFLISHLVRIAMLQLALQPVWEGLAERRWSDTQLAVLDGELSRHDFLADFDVAMRGERGFDIALIEYIRHSKKPMQELNSMIGDGDKSVLGTDVIAMFLGPSGWYGQNEQRIVAFYETWYLRVTDHENRTFSPETIERADKAIDEERESRSPCNVFPRLMLPALGGSAKKFALAQSSVDLARTAIALERYRLKQGEFPKSLDALTPEFMKMVPHDVIGGQPLRYHLTEAGDVVLYSVGWNGTDDGGVEGYGNDGKMLDITAGDWVWRYSQRAEHKD